MKHRLLRTKGVPVYRKDKLFDRPKHPTFEQMFSQHKGMVYAHARNIHKKMYNVEFDEIMNILILCFNSMLYSYDPNKGKFTTYFYRCRSTLYADVCRRLIIVQSEDAFEEDFFDIRTCTAPERDVVEQIKKLASPKELRVIKLYLTGLNYSDIARKMRVSTTYIGILMNNLRRKCEHLK